MQPRKEKPSVSVIIPAFNEEKNIEGAISATVKALQEVASRYEILIIDDASYDNTYHVATSFAKNNPNLKVLRNTTNSGYGYNFKKGVSLAQYDYIGMIPGDNEIEESSVKEIYSHVGEVDIIIPYTVNFNIRHLPRRIISKTFTASVNLLFGLNLKYFNGPMVYKTDVLKSITIDTDSFAFLAETLVKILKKKDATFCEVGMYLKKRGYGSSKAFRIKNIIGVLQTLTRLYFYVHSKNRRTA